MLSEKMLSIFAACAVTVSGLVMTTPAAAKQKAAKQKTVVVTGPLLADLPTRRVGYRDLNLATALGEKTLIRRVRFAVTDVCIEPDMHSETKCRKSAWAGAHPQIAMAVKRATEIAASGYSAIPPVAISIAFPQN